MKPTHLSNVVILDGLPFMLLPYHDDVDDFRYWAFAPLGVIQADIVS